MDWATERQVEGDHYSNQCTDTFIFLTSSLRYNAHTILVYSSRVFSIITEVYNHHKSETFSSA